jgi:hypothetical protein
MEFTCQSKMDLKRITASVGIRRGVSKGVEEATGHLPGG